MFKLSIKIDNAAFSGLDGEMDDEGRDREIARILHTLADRLEKGHCKGVTVLKDGNGNPVGSAEYTED